MSAIIPISRRKPLRKTLLNPNINSKMHTFGSAKSIVVQNGQPRTNAIQWDIDYDGSKAVGKLDLQNQDRAAHYNVNLNNIDLGPLLSIPTVAIPIDQRLRETFGVNNTSLGSVNNPSAMGSSFDDYVQPSFLFAPIGKLRSRKSRNQSRLSTLRKKYRVTPYPRNETKSLRKRKLFKNTLSRINR